MAKAPKNIDADISLGTPLVVEQEVGEVSVKQVLPTVKVVESNDPRALFTVVSIDSAGNERGKEFTIPRKEYQKYFSDTAKYKVKKNQ